MALIQCIECKKEISDTRDECIHCGMKIKSPPNLNYVTCSECGRKIDNSKDECMHCGMRIKDFSRDESIKYRDNWIDPRVLIKNSENKYEKDKGFVWKEETLKENNNDKINPSELIKEFKNNYKRYIKGIGYCIWYYNTRVFFINYKIRFSLYNYRSNHCIDCKTYHFIFKKKI